jgi:hypothetical protein
MSYPALISYDIVVDVASAEGRRTDRYAGQVKSENGDFRVAKFTESEKTNPSTPRGSNLSYSLGIGLSSGKRPVFKQTGDGLTLGHEGRIATLDSSPFAIPELSPLYSFGIQPCSPRSVHRAGDESRLKVIGTVASVNRRYQVDVVGQEQFDGRDSVHLHLTPIADARRDTLRDLWFAPSTYFVLGARVSDNFTDGSGGGTTWLVTFSTKDDAVYIDTERAEAPIRRGKTTYTSVVFSFQNVDAISGSPALSFATKRNYLGTDVIHEPSDGSEGPGGC